MAKPRKQKNDEQKPENSEGVILHQKLCISVDMENRRIYGHTEMKVTVPESGYFALFADNMTITHITLNGEQAEFDWVPRYQFVDDDSSFYSISCSESAADVACSTYISSLSREMAPNLIITCCDKTENTQNNMVEGSRDNIIENSCPEQPINFCNGHAEDKVICIDYWLERTEVGMHFGELMLLSDNQIKRAHCWFPCLYNFSQNCMFDLEFTVSSNFVVVSNGDLLYQILSNDDPPRKTFVYKLNVPINSSWISLSVGPFEVIPDNNIGSVSHMCLSPDLPKLHNTVGFFHNAFSHYEDYLSASFPFGSYKQVFVPPELSVSSVNIGASMCLFSSQLLFDEKVLDQTIETRIKLAYALARQWFGVYITAEELNDEWLLEGLAGFLTDSFIKRFLGNNEARYQRYKANYAVCKADNSEATALSSAAACSNLYGTQTIGLYGKIRSWKALAVLQMLEKQMGPDSFRKILQVIVYRALDASRPTRTLSTKEFRHLANKAGNLERPFLKEFFPRWIESCGCPILRMGLSYNKRRNAIELAVVRSCSLSISSGYSNNDNRDGDAGWPGMMSIRVHELDGMYDHPSLPMAGEACQLLEIQCHSKLAAKRIQKPKKGSRADGSDDNTDIVPGQDRTSMDSPLLWIRVDPEMEYLAEIHFHQPVQMWINQLEKDKDVVAQAQAIETLRDLPHLPFAVVNALNNFLCDSKAFWRVRIEAAYALAHTASEETDWAGLLHLIKFFKSRRFDADTGLPRPNDFQDVPEYFVLEAIPHAIAMVRAADKKSPREAVEFILLLLKYNDNNGNPYSDVYWLASLVLSISELEFGPQSISSLPSLLKCIDRLLQFDSLMPCYSGILTISCLRTLARVALKMSTSVSIDSIYELISPFTNLEKYSWKVCIEAKKTLLDLEYYSRGLDAVLFLLTKFLEDELSSRGQIKLVVHTMQLCQINAESQNGNDVCYPTSVALLRLLASKRAFNNVFLRHYLFCILQIVAGRAPTLYGLPKIQENHIVAMGSHGEQQPIRSASLKLKISGAQEVLADTPNHSVDKPAAILESAKEADTVSNCSERRSNILKIRVKQPSSSSKADDVNQLAEHSHVAPIETDLGPCSSVSVGAPIKIRNQNVEEENSSWDRESRMTASIGCTKLVNRDESMKELQCTAYSSNAPGDCLSPTSNRKDEAANRIRKKEKKDKERKRKHEHKDAEKHRSDDPEYLERRRRKKERKQLEKRMSQIQENESKTAAVELQGSTKPLESSGDASSRDLKNLEQNHVHNVSKSIESASEALQVNKGTRIKIKIKNQSVIS